MMSKFIGVFRELSTFTELLHTQIELILVERLHHNWLKVLLPDAVKPMSHCLVYALRLGSRCHALLEAAESYQLLQIGLTASV